MVVTSKQRLSSGLGESVVTSKVTYVGENRPDVFISRRTEAQLFKGLRTYNWSKSIGARTQTLDRLSNSMYSILQSYNTFQSFASTQNFALSIMGRAAWIVGGRALGKIQGKIVPQGGGPFGRFMRVQAGHMSRQILTNAMKFFVSVDFSIDNVQKVQKDVTADLMKANAIGPQWQLKTHAQAIKNAPNYKLGGFGAGKDQEKQDGLLSEAGIRASKRNSQTTQNLIEAGFTAPEVMALQRFADSQLDNMSDDQIENVLNAFGKDRANMLKGLSGGTYGVNSQNTLYDFGRDVLPGNSSMNGISFDSNGNMYYESPDIDLSTGGMYTPGDLATFAPHYVERTEKQETRRKKGRDAQNEKAREALDKGDMKKFNNIRRHTSKPDKKKDFEYVKKTKRGAPGVMTYINENGQLRLRPRDMNVSDLNEYVENFGIMAGPIDGIHDYEKHREVGQTVIDNPVLQYELDNTIYSQRLIQSSITRDAPLIGGNANDNRGFLGFSVTFGEGLKDAQQVEFGGPATDKQGSLRNRSDRFVYPRSLFLTRAGERAAQMLDVDGDISYSQAKGGVLHHMKKNRDKFDSKGRNKERQQKSEFKLIVDRRVRDFAQENAQRARDVAFNNQTGRFESVKRSKISDGRINEYFDKYDKGKTFYGGSTSVVRTLSDGTTSLVDLNPGQYPAGFENGLDKIKNVITEHMQRINLTGDFELANNEFYRRLGRVGRGGRAGIVMGDDHLEAMGMSRNRFGNRPFLDTQKLQNQNLYGGIFDATDVEGAILAELQKASGEAITEAYKAIELKSQALQMTKLKENLEPHLKSYPKLKNIKLSKNGQVEAGGRSYAQLSQDEKIVVDRAMASAKQTADKFYEKEVLKLENQFQNPENLGIFQEHFGGTDDWTGEKALKVITDKVNRHLEGVIQSSAARPKVEFNGRTIPFTGRMAGREIMRIREFTNFEQTLVDDGFFEAIVGGKAQPINNEVLQAIKEKRALLLEDVADSMAHIKSLGISDFGEFVQFAGYGQELLNNDDILRLAKEAGIGVKKTGRYYDRSGYGKWRGHYDNKKINLDPEGVEFDGPEDYKQFMKNAREKSAQGVFGRSVNASKTNVYGDATAQTKSGGHSTREKFFFNLDGEHILKEHRINLSSPESRQIIKDYKTIRNQINKGGFTWVNESKKLRYYRDVRKTDYGDRAETSSGQNLQNTLNRLIKNVRFSGHNENVIHLLLSLEDSAAVSAYFQTTMDPSHPLNKKQYGFKAKSKNFGPPKPLDKSKIAYYQAVLSKTTPDVAGNSVSGLQMLKNILLN